MANREPAPARYGKGVVMGIERARPGGDGGVTRRPPDPATPHTLEVRNLGTAGRSRVDVDAFVVLR